MTLSIVDARPEHTSFVAWVLLTSHRSHLPKGMWDFLVGDRTEDTLAFLEALAGSPEPAFPHYPRFNVAEVQGPPVAYNGCLQLAETRVTGRKDVVEKRFVGVSLSKQCSQTCGFLQFAT